MQIFEKLLWFLVLFSTIVYTGCKERNKADHEIDCPYQFISNSETFEDSNLTTKNTLKNLSGKLNASFKKFKLGEVEGKYLVEWDEKTKNIIERNISYDTSYVKNYNALVSDICGKLKIFESLNLNSNDSIKLKNDILKRVEKFYELVTIKDSKPLNVNLSKKNRNRKQIEWVEIPFQLNKKYLGYKEIFINGKLTAPLGNSTQLNPRVNINTSNSQSFHFIITTKNGDTCRHTLAINDNFKNNFIGRIPIR